MRILSLNVTHDSAVCSVKDGELEFFCKEERLTKRKRDSNPVESVDLFKKLNFGPVDFLVYSTPSNYEEAGRQRWLEILSEKLKDNGNQIKLVEYPHHLCHAMLAYTNSGFDESLVFVIDRDGSAILINDSPVARESQTVFVFNRAIFKNIYKEFWLMDRSVPLETVQKELESLFKDCDVACNSEYSTVKVYEAATTLIGQSPLENGKTMGLSSYGEDLDYEELIINGVPQDHKFTNVPKGLNEVVCFLGEESLIIDQINSENYQHYANRAKQVQLQTQKCTLELIKKYVETTGIKNVCLVGGYALNIVANNYYLKNLPEVQFYFEPNADDTGVPLGAAMLVHLQATGEFPAPMKDNFYHYYDQSETLDIGKSADIQELVSLLGSGKSVAIFDGNPEAGPRALGHRSILFDARNPQAREIVNRIKKREWYRPFAGVILESKFAEYFDTAGMTNSPYMTVNFDAKQSAKDLVPGIIHVDGTCRVQTVQSGFLKDLLIAFDQSTSCPMLLNTSFNLAGAPLVQTKSDAVEVLRNSELDAVYFVETGRLVVKSDLE